MKRLSNYLLIVLATLLMFGFTANTSAKETETEGTAFWFAIPWSNHYSTETARGSLSGNFFELWITSKVSTNIRLYDAHQTLIKSYTVVGGKYTAIPIPDDKMHVSDDDEKVIKNKAMYLEADDPISLIVYCAYYNTGEAYRVIPAQWLGTDYYTLNLFNDYLLFMSESNPRTTPNQILIVATEDQTEVEIYPAAETKKHVDAGEKISVTLNQGESYIVMSDTNYITAQYDETDLTGSHIVADKPIAVFSGHTKGTFPKFAPKYYGIRCDWGRNMLFDSMWPTNLLGKLYVTVPNSYLDREKHYQGLIAEEGGDMIRFVATQPNTIVYQMKKDSSGWAKLGTIKKAGQWLSINTEKEPQYYKTSAPCLVGQYAKSSQWWPGGSVHYKEGDANSKEDELMNPSEVGQGQLYAVTPTEQWANYSGFVSPVGVINWFNLIFKTGEESHISMNGTPITELYGSAIKKIKGSPYSYVSQPSSTGGNYVVSDKSDVLFSVYAYGDLDAYKNGFAYGYPTTVNYFQPCADSIHLEAELNCNVLTGTLTAVDLQTDTSCASIQSFKYEVSTRHNAKFSSEVKPGQTSGDFTVTFSDENSEGYIKLIGVTKSGASVSKEFYYYPEVLTANPDKVQYGLLEAGQSKDIDVVLTNGGSKDIHVKRLYLKNSDPTFTILTSPVNDFTIAAGESKTYTIRAEVNATDAVASDELYAELDCTEPKLATLTVSSGDPNITMNDLEWKNIPVGQNYQQTKEVIITNNGSNPCYITGYTLAKTDDTHFTFTGNVANATPDNPVAIAANGGTETLYVTYDHLNESGVNHTQTFTVTSPNTTKTKLYSVWNGNAINASLAISSYDWGAQRVIDDWNRTENGINNYSATVTVTNGGTDDINISNVYLYNTDTKTAYTDGIFSIDQSDLTSLVNNGLAAGSSKDLKVYFAPTAQTDYSCNIQVLGVFAGETKESNIGILEGKGKQPHVQAYDADFGRLNLQEVTDTTVNVQFDAITPVTGEYAMDLQVVGLRITGTDAAKFDFMNGFTVPSKSNPVTVKAGETYEVPVTFTPQDPNDVGYNAQLEIVTDAPATDDNIAALIGRAFDYGQSTTDLLYPVTYITTTRTGSTVTFKNQGSTKLYIVKSLYSSIEDAVANSGESGSFDITKIYVDSDPNTSIDKYASTIEIPVNATLVTEFNFTPTEVKEYTGKLHYTYTVEDPASDVQYDAYSTMRGSGKDYHAVIEIPTGYKAKPGETAYYSNGGEKDSYAEMKFYPASSETKELSDADIQGFSALFTFGSATYDKDAKHFYPEFDGNGNIDIITDGTMTNGWEVTSAKVLDDGYTLKVDMKNNSGKALSSSNDNVLFKFRLRGYLSKTGETIPFSPYILPDGQPASYTFVEEIDGDGEILTVCVDSMRLIEYTGQDYSLTNVTPNPVVTDGTIGFTVPIECPVLLEVFDETGAKVKTLVNNEMKTPGTYQTTFDANALGLTSGTYTYRIQMGPFVQTKTMVITK